MTTVVQVGLASLTQLGLFGLLALSLALVFGVSRVVNLAVGDLAAVGAYAMVMTAALPFTLRVLVTLVVLAPLLVLLERGLLARVRDGLAGMLLTWGVGIGLRQLCEVVYTATPRSVAPPVEGSLSLLGTTYPTARLVAAAVGLLVCAGVLAVAYGTRTGLRLRAVADSAPTAALLGVDPARTRAVTFAVAGLLAVLAGALYSPHLGVSPTLGFSLLVPGFVALLLARPGSFGGAFTAVAVLVVLQVVLRRLVTDTLADSLFYAVVLAAVVVRATPHTRRFVSWSARTASSVWSSTVTSRRRAA